MREVFMPKNPHTEQEPWWPDALARFDQLASEGKTESAACKALAEEFPRGDCTFSLTCQRGSVSAYPPKDIARAAAWRLGKERYDGKPCPVHGTTVRFSNDGICVSCKKEQDEQRRAKVQDWKAAERANSADETGSPAQPANLS